MAEAARYTRTAIALHWLLAAAILVQILLGWSLDEIPRGTPARSWWVNLHKSTGLTIGVLIAVRLTWRWGHPPPRLPGSMPAWERAAADASHRLLYACMLVMPLTGYVASNFSKYGVRFFNVVLLPPWGPENAQVYAVLNGTHVITSYVFVALIGIHLVSALRHLFLRDGIFQRMWPRVGAGRQAGQ
ncbi:cytochrome b [Povalibacter sp.]|uniref:cytochrome b n=1 Tax=Povalibacter sp. TaxID=1962978 RepID=UPI002F4292E4